MRSNNSILHIENYIIFGNINSRMAELDNIISEMKISYPEKFEGKIESFVFEFRYVEPFDKNFNELKRLQGIAAENAGRKNEFRGYVVIDLDRWLTHRNEEYFNIALLFLIDMSDCWKYIFLVDDKNLKVAKELVGKVMSFFIRNNITCKVIEENKRLSDMEQVNKICKEQGITYSSLVCEFLQNLINNHFSEVIISSLITEISWYYGKRINMDIIRTFLTSTNSSLRFMVPQKEFDKLILCIEQQKEKENEEKKAI